MMEPSSGRREVPVLNISHEHSVSADTEHGLHSEQVPMENTRMPWLTPMKIVYILFGICAIAGAIVGVIITVQYKELDDNKPSRSEQLRPEVNPTTAAPAVETATEPAKQVQYAMRMFAIGSWGASPNFIDSKDGQYPYRGDEDRAAQEKVAALMASFADTKPTPHLILSQGNNFNWHGLLAYNDFSAAARFDQTFTSKYNHTALNTIPWAVIMGKNDVGGGAFLCGKSEETLHACGNEKSIVAGLQRKFAMQTYSPPIPTAKKHKGKRSLASVNAINNTKWILRDHYYKETIQSPDGAISVDIFNVNVLVHAATIICCQCLGYSPPERMKECPTIHAKSDYCAGGNRAFFKACRDELLSYSRDSFDKFVEDAQSSTATYKIINGHISPLDMTAKERTKWMQALENAKIHLWLHGSTPGMNHVRTESQSSKLRSLKSHKKHKRSHADETESKAPVIHFIGNGIGGGIPTQPTTKDALSSSDANVKFVHAMKKKSFGFLDLAFNSTALRINLRTIDEGEKYCYEIPQNQHGNSGRGGC